MLINDLNICRAIWIKPIGTYGVTTGGRDRGENACVCHYRLDDDVIASIEAREGENERKSERSEVDRILWSINYITYIILREVPPASHVTLGNN